MRIYVASTLFNGNEMVRQLIERGVGIAGIIGLDDGVAGPAVSGYESPAALCERYGLDFVRLASYSMSAPGDRSRIESLDIDLALVLGWQRLVPNWFLACCSIGAIGVHGSADGVTGGRGRSPQNWAILLDRPVFHLSIFFADAGVDSGPLIDSASFPLTPWDDIRTSHLKAGRATVELIARNLVGGRIERREAVPQNGSPGYLPKRAPDDGAIDWNRSAVAICAFVRALTRPYPGAFSVIGSGRIVKIWRVRPFLEETSTDASPGTVVDRFESGDFLVATATDLLHVEDYEIDGADRSIRSGEVLPSVDFDEQLAAIAARHRADHPDLPLADAIVRRLTEGATS